MTILVVGTTDSLSCEDMASLMDIVSPYDLPSLESYTSCHTSTEGPTIPEESEIITGKWVRAESQRRKEFVFNAPTVLPKKNTVGRIVSMQNDLPDY